MRALGQSPAVRAQSNCLKLMMVLLEILIPCCRHLAEMGVIYLFNRRRLHFSPAEVTDRSKFLSFRPVTEGTSASPLMRSSFAFRMASCADGRRTASRCSARDSFSPTDSTHPLHPVLYWRVLIPFPLAARPLRKPTLTLKNSKALLQTSVSQSFLLTI